MVTREHPQKLHSEPETQLVSHKKLTPLISVNTEVLKIAEGDLNIDYAQIRNIEYNFAGDAERISQEIFRVWSYKSHAGNQMQVGVDFRISKF